MLAVHEAQLAEHGGATGVRDHGLLDSALARPLNAAEYGDPDVCKFAGLYAIGFVKNHPFLDGNKRVGYVLLNLFLELNGLRITANQMAKYNTLYSLAAGDISDQAFVDWIRANSAPK